MDSERVEWINLDYKRSDLAIQNNHDMSLDAGPLFYFSLFYYFIIIIIFIFFFTFFFHSF